MVTYSWRGLDAETQDGRAILLCTSSRFCEPRSWSDVWSFLRVEPLPSYYTTFNLPYDARAMLCLLPARALRELRASGSTEYHGWHVQLWARRVLRIRKAGDSARVELYDVWPYFGMSLDAAADKWLDKRKKPLPKSWLPRMAWALKHHRAKVLEYCHYDAQLPEELWALLVAQYESLGVDPHRGASPASLALRAYADSFKDLGAMPWENETFRRTYYGGRIEVLRRGHFGKVYIYDINSAYPSALATLPDPRGADTLAVRTVPRQDALYGAYRLRVRVPLDMPVPPLPCRTKKMPITFPVGVWETWVDKVTLGLLGEAGIKYDVLDGWEIVSDEEPTLLFPGIEEWYAKRRANPECAHALKITLNALYGKTAEMVYARISWKNGQSLRGVYDHGGKLVRKIRVPSRHTHFAVAAACTAICRAAMWRAIHLRPGVVVAVATDGLISTKPLSELDGGLGLGEWRLKHKADEAFIVGTGIYAFREGDKWTERFRGFHVDAGVLVAMMSRKRKVAKIKIKHALTLAEAAREKTGKRMRDRLNRMEVLTKKLDLNFDRKRQWPKPWGSFAEMSASKPQRSRPWVIVG